MSALSCRKVLIYTALRQISTCVKQMFTPAFIVRVNVVMGVFEPLGKKSAIFCMFRTTVCLPR